MSQVSLACQANRESNKLDSAAECTEKSTESAQKSRKFSKVFGIALCAFALSINGCAIVQTIKTSEFEGTIIENASANMNFPQNDCLNGQPVRFYAQDELRDLNLLISNQVDTITGLSKFDEFFLPKNVTNKVNASGIKVRNLGGGKYRLTYYNGYSEFGVGSSPRNPYEIEAEYGAMDVASSAVSAVSSTLQLANTATSLFGQIFSGSSTSSASNSKNAKEPDPEIQDYYTKASFDIELSILDNDNIGIKKVTSSSFPRPINNIPYLGGSLEELEKDVDNIIKNFKFGVKVDNVKKVNEGVIKTPYVRGQSVILLLLKNGFDGVVPVGEEKKERLGKSINIGAGQNMGLVVDVDCPLNKNCDVKYESIVGYYRAYSDGSCSVTGETFNAASSKAVAELRGILE